MTIATLLAGLAVVSMAGADGRDPHVPSANTAAGHPPIAGVSMACERSFPLGTVVDLEGLGPRRCDDRMAARFEGGPVNFDVYAPTTREALAWGRRQIGYRLAQNAIGVGARTVPGTPAGMAGRVAREHLDTTVQVWARKNLWSRCASAPTTDGTYLASHCLPLAPGPGWTVYVGTHRVTTWSVDPVRDLAHVPVNADPRIVRRTPQPGEGGRVAGMELTAGPVVMSRAIPSGFLPGGPMPLRVWCDSARALRHGLSGSGIVGADGAQLGIVVGGNIDDARPSAYDPNETICPGPVRVVLAVDVP